MCIWSTTVDQYIWNKAIDLSIVFVWKCTWLDKAENGVRGKEIQLFLLNGIKLVKMHLMVSLYIWLSIYTYNETLRIIWKFDFSSRGGLGRIYALSIEVLKDAMTALWRLKLGNVFVCIHVYFGLFINISIQYFSSVMRNPAFAICEQQRRRSACAFAQSDQRLCSSLPG